MFFFACILNIWQLLIVFHLAPTVVCSLTSARVIKNACIHLINTGEQVVYLKKNKKSPVPVALKTISCASVENWCSGNSFQLYPNCSSWSQKWVDFQWGTLTGVLFSLVKMVLTFAFSSDSCSCPVSSPCTSNLTWMCGSYIKYILHWSYWAWLAY